MLLKRHHKKFEVTEDEKKFFIQIMDLLEPAEKRRYDNIYEKAKERQIQESMVLKGRNYGLNCDISAKRPFPTGLAPSASRLFLTNLGFLSLTNHTRFYVVQPFNSTQPYNYSQHLKSIDQARERETYSVGVVYLTGETQKLEDEMFENTAVSAEYKEFINSIGWATKLQDHLGFKAGLDNTQQTGEFTPYYATYDYEIIFHVCSLMPNIDKLTHKKRLLTNDKVLITWVEDLTNYDTKHTKQYDISMNIVISPMSSGLFRIKIYKAKNLVQIIGPLLDEMVVSKNILATMVRETAVNACKVLKDDKTKPFMKRRQLIEEFIHTQKQIESPHNFYSAHFFEL